MSPNHDAVLLCAFCGKSLREVRRLIAGPKVHICDECIDLCNDVIEEEQAALEGSPAEKAERLAGLASRLAFACREEPVIPRDVADRASALAEEIEALARR